MNLKRIILGIVIIVCLVILMTFSYINYDIKQGEITRHTYENFHEYNETEVSFLAYILSINTSSKTILVQVQEPPAYPRGTISYSNLPENIQKNDLIDVFGIKTAEDSYQAREIIKKEEWKENLIIIRSLPAIPLLLYFFIKTWSFNKKSLKFQKRRWNHR